MGRDIRTSIALAGALIVLALVTRTPRAMGPIAALATTPQPSPSAPSAAAITVDVVAIDRDGKLVDGLNPDNFSVTVDGRARRVLWLRHVSRGPGANADAARRLPRRTDTLTFAAEPVRDLLVIIDEASIPRGAEAPVVRAASGLIDRFGLDDRIGVVRIPLARDSELSFSTNRPAMRTALRQVVGRANLPGGPGPADRADTPAWPPVSPEPMPAPDEPERADPGERERPRVDRQEQERAVEQSTGGVAGVVASLREVLRALQASNGRKIVAVFSAGWPAEVPSDLDAVIVAAAQAHAAVHTFGVQNVTNDPARVQGFDALQQLAKATGGTFTPIGKNPDKSLERVTPEFAACYVVGIEPSPSDDDGRRHALRIELPGQRVTLRAPAWLVARPDVEDRVPFELTAAGSGAPQADAAAVEGRPAASGRDAAQARKAGEPARDVELHRLLERAADYVARYQRESSLLVVEEEYYQSTRGQRQTLRSDVLMVRPPRADGWISFRDVFEVDGKAVRDRDDRLKRLFLEPSGDSGAQLRAIMDESARYNIGQVYRNINVPLFALEVLEPANLWRFRFKLTGKQSVDDLAVWRVTFEEEGRPTLVHEHEMRDLPSAGWFLIDPASGAIVRSRMEFMLRSPTSKMEYEVRYRRDEALGLWVPREMTEEYFVWSGPAREMRLTVDARATYSKFRRFQVTTEEHIQIPK